MHMMFYFNKFIVKCIFFADATAKSMEEISEEHCTVRKLNNSIFLDINWDIFVY